MTINFLGISLFEIIAKTESKNLVQIVIDPFNEKLGLKVPRLKAQVLLVSHPHEDHANVKAVGGSPFLIEGPGEYETHEIFIKGIPAFHDNQEGKNRGLVTIYKIEAEGMNVCHLSDFGQKELTSEQLEKIGEVDILMIPVGGNYTIGPKEAATIVSQVEPKVVIPMHYKLPGLKLDIEGVDKFLKIMGQEAVAIEPKLKVSLKDLPQEETKIVVLAVS